MPMAVKCVLFLYGDDTCLDFQSKNVKDIEKQLNEDFVNICDWSFDYVCSAWYPNLSKKTKNRIQTLQNKCIRFCLQLDKMSHISEKAFETINWLPIKERYNQCVNSTAFKYFDNQCPHYYQKHQNLVHH